MVRNQYLYKRIIDKIFSYAHEELDKVLTYS